MHVLHHHQLFLRPTQKGAAQDSLTGGCSASAGDLYVEYSGIGGPAPVIFGEKGDSNLLGASTLEALELILDPFKCELRPMTTTLMGASPFR